MRSKNLKQKNKLGRKIGEKEIKFWIKIVNYDEKNYFYYFRNRFFDGGKFGICPIGNRFFEKKNYCQRNRIRLPDLYSAEFQSAKKISRRAFFAWER
jgi:hypothetical protein